MSYTYAIARRRRARPERHLSEKPAAFLSWQPHAVLLEKTAILRLSPPSLTIQNLDQFRIDVLYGIASPSGVCMRNQDVESTELHGKYRIKDMPGLACCSRASHSSLAPAEQPIHTLCPDFSPISYMPSGGRRCRTSGVTNTVDQTYSFVVRDREIHKP